MAWGVHARLPLGGHSNLMQLTARTHHGANKLPPPRCARHLDAPRQPPCPSCIRAQQRRLEAHYAASAAAADAWRRNLVLS